VLLEIAGIKILFDVGAGTIRRLLEAGTSIDQVTAILISHLHPDHTGELASFLFSAKNVSSLARTAPLTIGAGKGFRSFHSRLVDAFDGQIALGPHTMAIKEFDTDKQDTLELSSSITIRSMPLSHANESIGYRVAGTSNRAVVYTGDTDACDNLVSLAWNADLMVCESSFPDEMKVKGHLTPSLAGEIATRANVGKLVLTHFYPQCDATDMVKQCRETYSGCLLLAEDLMEITL